jgi:TatA/E family protein of Tat protein translocase
MLSLPHLVVLFVIALVIFGPQKLPELARMLGKATAEFRKMTNDFRYALEDEVRELERQTRIREEEAAAAARAAQVPAIPAATAPEGSVPRETPDGGVSATPAAEPATESQNGAGASTPMDTTSQQATPETVSVPHEKPTDDNPAV